VQCDDIFSKSEKQMFQFSTSSNLDFNYFPFLPPTHTPKKWFFSAHRFLSREVGSRLILVTFNTNNFLLCITILVPQPIDSQTYISFFHVLFQHVDTSSEESLLRNSENRFSDFRVDVLCHIDLDEACILYTPTHSKSA